MGPARIGIFLIVIIVLILLGQSVRNRTVLKYDPATRQVVQVPKSELGNSVEVLRPASEIVVEIPEEVEERFENTLAENLDEEAIAVVKDEIKKKSWYKKHEMNSTGTENFYTPKNSASKKNNKNYESWSPENK